MRTLSFSTAKDKILVSKFCTIRPKRKSPYKVGELVKLYWKQRTKNNEVLGYARIKETPPLRFCDLSFTQLSERAQEDGFATIREMLEYFEKRYGPDYWTMDFEINRFDKVRDFEFLRTLEREGALKGIVSIDEAGALFIGDAQIAVLPRRKE